MAENKNVQDMDSSEVVIAKAKSFWDKYSKSFLHLLSWLLAAGMCTRIFSKNQKKQKLLKRCSGQKNIIAWIQ